MTIVRSQRSHRSQMGYVDSPTSAYTQAGGDLNFNANQISFFRQKTMLTPGMTVNNATLTFELLAKNGGTAQTCSTRIRAHKSIDSPMLRIGQLEAWPDAPHRPETTAYVDWVATWPANPPGAVLATVNVTSIVQELLAQPNFQPGAYITFFVWVMNENGSDMGYRANHDWSPPPMLEIDYTLPEQNTKYTINECENSEFSSEILNIRSSGETGTVPYWGQNDFFGAWAPGNGTIERDTTFTRLSGIPTMKFTCGTPAEDVNRRTGPMTYFGPWRSDRPWIFNGWIYISNSVPTTSELWIGDPYHGQSGTVITARGQWVPFCTTPLVWPGDTGWGTRYPAAGLNKFQSGWQFWISEPGFFESAFKQMPFNGLTPDLKENGGTTTLIEHRTSVSTQQSARIWTPRTAVVRGGVVKRVPRYTKRTDGILQLAEPVRGGPQVQNLAPGVTVANLPATITSSEL